MQEKQEAGNNIEETETIWWKEIWGKKGEWIIKWMTIFEQTEGLSSGKGGWHAEYSPR